jgi:uncharacterized protein YaaQ
MKTIEQYLKDNNFTAIESLKGGYCLDGKEGNLYTRLLNAMEEMLIDAYNEALEDAAKKATICEDPNSYCGNTGSEYPPDLIVNKQSILKLKK